MESISNKQMRRALFIFLCVVFIAVGCETDGDALPVNDPAPTPQIIKISGSGQDGIIGLQLDNPFLVRVRGESGEPLAAVRVNFTIESGLGTLSSNAQNTDANGFASVYLTPGGSLEKIKVRVSSEGFKDVVFKSAPLLPPLSYVAGATVDDKPVADRKVMYAQTETGQDVLAVFLGEDAGVTFNTMPKVADILGGTIRGAAVEDIPTLFLPASALVDKTYTDMNPTASTVAASFLADGISGSAIPVVTYLNMNGAPAVVAILDDPAGIPGFGILGTMLANGDTVIVDGVPVFVGDLPFYGIMSANFPADPLADNYSYKSTACCSVIPMYNALEPVGGAALTTLIPLYFDSIPISKTEPVEVVSGETPLDVAVLDAPAGADVGAPITTLRPLALDWIPVVEAIREIRDVSAGNEKVMASLLNNFMGIVGWALNNIDVFGGLLGGGGAIELYDIAYLLVEPMPMMNGMAKDMLVILPDLEQQLILIETKLLPAMEAGLLDVSGLNFGGYSDAIPSNVTGDVLPMLQGMVDVLQNMLPVIERMAFDLDVLIPDDLDMLQLLVNTQDGDLANVITDLNELIPMMGDLLALINNPGMTLIKDLNEELVFRYNGTSTTLGDLGVFQDLVSCLGASLPPDLKLIDIEIFTALIDLIGPMLGGAIDPATLENLTLFGDLIPMLGSLGAGDALPGLLTMVTDLLAGILPGLVDTLQNFPGIPTDIF